MPDYVVRFPTASAVAADIISFLAGLFFGRQILQLVIPAIPSAIGNYENNTFIKNFIMPVLFGDVSGLSTEQAVIMLIIGMIAILLIIRFVRRLLEIAVMFILGLVVHNMTYLIFGIDLNVEYVKDLVFGNVTL